MGASVRIEDEAFSDTRYDRLAIELGLPDADCARGKMLRIWRQCTLEQKTHLGLQDVQAVLGERGSDALVNARLGELVQTKSGPVMRIRGAKGRIEWLGRLRKNGRYGRLGGRPRKNPQGFAGKPTRLSKSDENKTPPAPAPAPAPVSYEREIGAPPTNRVIPGPVGDSIDAQEAERVMAGRYGFLGPHAVAVAGLFPVTRAEWDEATASNGKSWPYFAKVVRSIRERAASPPSKTTRDPRTGYHPGSRPEDFHEGDQPL